MHIVQLSEIFIGLQDGHMHASCCMFNYLSMLNPGKNWCEVEMNQWTQSSEGYDLINVNDVVQD